MNSKITIQVTFSVNKWSQDKGANIQLDNHQMYGSSFVPMEEKKKDSRDNESIT